jgi:hypothetical protein
MSGTENYLGVVTANEIDQLHTSIPAEAHHPLIVLAKATKPHDVATNTENAARSILRKDQNWLTKLKPRLLDTSDFTNSSSALGELRAYGALLDTAMAVSPNPGVPGKKVMPEFEVNAGDGAVIVEVHSRQLDPAQAKAITEHRKMHRAEHKIALEEAKKAGEKGVVTSSTIGVVPLGAPDPRKPGDSVLTNSISRICGIKNEEKQIDPEKPFVLWLDLQDTTVWGVSLPEQQLSPIFSQFRSEGVDSGALWFALYGRKGDPMIEMRGCDYHQIAMLHDGRFTLSLKISAVVYSLPRTTVLMEHPAPARPLPPKFRASMLNLPFFALERSVCEWTPGLVAQYLHYQRTMVAEAAQALVASNPP